MIAFEIFLNGQKLTLAGADDMCVLGCGLSCLLKNNVFYLKMGGLTSPEEGKAQEFVDWFELKELNLNDEIRIKILDIDKADSPVKRRKKIP